MQSQFYDALAPLYHLIYADWEASILWQGASLAGIIQECWGQDAKSVLDLACGIGTQSLALAQQGFRVTASDLSPRAVERAKDEASQRGLEVTFSVADMRQAFQHHRRQFDVVLACDNALPHLLSDAEILEALEEFYQCTRPGGGCLISVRDYAAMDRHSPQVHPYGVRTQGNTRYLILQVWEFEGAIYDLSLYLVKDEGGARCQTEVMRAKYYAVSIDRLMELMIRAGYDQVERLDGRFFQPVIIGTRPKDP